jgi:hypothetical protein
MLPLDEKSPFFFGTSWDGLRGVEKGGRQIQPWHFADAASNQTLARHGVAFFTVQIVPTQQ